MKDNVHTWVRLARFDLQHLSISLGNAALDERKNWPSDGQGREVKRLTEEITRTLETTFDRRDLNFTFDVLENAILKLSTISGKDFIKRTWLLKLIPTAKASVARMMRPSQIILLDPQGT